jgi:hypothetical protein
MSVKCDMPLWEEVMDEHGFKYWRRTGETCSKDAVMEIIFTHLHPAGEERDHIRLCAKHRQEGITATKNTFDHPDKVTCEEHKLDADGNWIGRTKKEKI